MGSAPSVKTPAPSTPGRPMTSVSLVVVAPARSVQLTRVARRTSTLSEVAPDGAFVVTPLMVTRKGLVMLVVWKTSTAPTALMSARGGKVMACGLWVMGSIWYSVVLRRPVNDPLYGSIVPTSMFCDVIGIG